MANEARKYGIGEYESGSDGPAPPSVVEMRSRFLQRAGELYPNVVDDLIADLLPLYQCVPIFCYEANKDLAAEAPGVMDRWSWYSSCRPSWDIVEKAWNNRKKGERFELRFDPYFSHWDAAIEDWNTYLFEEYPLYHDEHMETLVRGLFNWSVRHNLDEEWCREHAFETLDFWVLRDDLLGDRTWLPMPLDFTLRFYPLAVSKHKSFEFKFRHCTLYPEEGRRSDVEKQITEEFKLALSAFLDERKQESVDLGLRKSLKKYKDNHFDLLAKYLIGNQSYGDLTDKYQDKVFVSDDTSKVRKSIGRLSKTLGIRLERKQ